MQRARWALDENELDELKECAAYFGLDKTKDFEDYKSKYMKAMRRVISQYELDDNFSKCEHFQMDEESSQVEIFLKLSKSYKWKK